MVKRLCAGFVAWATTAVVDGHCFLNTPTSRAYSMTRDFQEGGDITEHGPETYNAGGTTKVQERALEYTDPALFEAAGIPDEDTWPLLHFDRAENGNYNEPNGIAVRHGFCGDPKTDEDPKYSTPNIEWDVLGDCHQAGGVIEIVVTIMYYHMGHFEFRLCDTGDLDDPDGVVTQECANKYQLDRVPNENQPPIDPNYKGRYFADPPCRSLTGETEQNTSDWLTNDRGQYYRAYDVHMSYRLPNIESKHSVLQMHYMTGNRACNHIGYADFNPDSWNSECAPNKSDWMDVEEGATCGRWKWYPEEFWGCSDICIEKGSDESSPVTSPTPDTTEPPIHVETPAPTPATTEAPPVDEPTPAPVDDVETPAPTPATTEAPPVDEPTPAPVDGVETPAPTPATTEVPPVGEGTPPPTGETVYLGCFHDSRGDRVLGHQLDSSEMTNQVCLEHCTALGAALMATQYGYECWCSADGGLDYERHSEGTRSDAVCDYSCQGDAAQTCGGLDAFDLYQLSAGPSMCTGAPLEAYSQCGGLGWEGSTCCMDGYECTEMGDGGCYSQCRP